MTSRGSVRLRDAPLALTSTITPFGSPLGAMLLFLLWPMPDVHPGDTPGVALMVLEPLMYAVLIGAATWLAGAAAGAASLIRREGRVLLAAAGLVANGLLLATLVAFILRNRGSV
jgi:hypothetical protein